MKVEKKDTKWSSSFAYLCCIAFKVLQLGVVGATGAFRTPFLVTARGEEQLGESGRSSLPYYC